MATAAIDLAKIKREERATSFAYKVLFLFTFLYYARPEDMIPLLGAIPVGKITGGIALLALIFGVRGKGKPTSLPTTIKILMVLFAHMLLTIPFAYWRGGAFDAVINKFSKGVIVALLISMIIASVKEMRRLLWIQAAAVCVMTTISVVLARGGAKNSVRLHGALGGPFENPNDLAINIAINFPICLTFFLGAKGIKKILWGVGLLFMMYGVVATYSRSGFIAMAISVLVCLWEYGVKGKRRSLIIGAVVISLLGLGAMATKKNYLLRLSTLVHGGDVAGSGDKGSIEERKHILTEAIVILVKHPVFGVGPGNFPSFTKEWLVTHNSYAELGAETGFPGLLLFLAVLISALRALNRARKSPGYEHDEQVRLFVGGLWASVAAYMVGAMFASTEYNLFPYFMVAYACALERIAFHYEPTGSGPVKGNGNERELRFDSRRYSGYAWGR